MSIQRLRQVLSSNFTAVVDSSQATVNKVQYLANARQQNLTAAGKTPPRTKATQGFCRKLSPQIRHGWRGE